MKLGKDELRPGQATWMLRVHQGLKGVSFSLRKQRLRVDRIALCRYTGGGGGRSIELKANAGMKSDRDKLGKFRLEIRSKLLMLRGGRLWSSVAGGGVGAKP